MVGSATTSVMRMELGKLSAFLRRDALVSWSYRLAFFADWANVVVQVALFYFTSRLVDQSRIPAYGGVSSYIDFVAVGIAFSTLLQVSLTRVVTAIRNEQWGGTLESLLVTPTSPATLQMGAVVYDLVYVPIRTGVFLGLMVLVFGVDLHASGIGPAAAILLAFIPFSWGLGLISAAGVLTMRRGAGAAGIAGMAMTLLSGAYFPLEVFPSWMETIARYNPLTLALDGARDALLGGAGWSVVPGPVLVLLPLAAVTLVAGTFAFRAAVDRERRKGTLFLY